MKILNFTIFVLASVSGIAAIIRQDKFALQSGYLVNTVSESITARSAAVCAAACYARNDVTPGSCQTATYESVTKACKMSTNGLWDATSGLGTDYKTIVVAEDCSGGTPSVSNGVLNIYSQSSSAATAILQCNVGYDPLPNSPASATCSVPGGWSIAGIGCTITPTTTYYGTSFLTGFMKNGETNSGVPTIHVLSSPGEASLTISVPHLSINDNVTTVGGVYTRTFLNTLTSATSGAISTKAVHITSDIPVTLFSANMKSGSSDGSLVLPESSLGFYYLTSGHPSSNVGVDEFLIIATTDATLFTMDFKDATQESITLNRMQSYYRQGVDLSGTKIIASSPVFVLSGHVCANIPDSASLYCDYLDEIMPPIPSLGLAHIVPFMKPRSDFTISIISPTASSVTLYDSLGNVMETVQLVSQIPLFRTYTTSLTLSIVSDAPILVTQYGHGSHLTLGDPSMMTIPDITHYGSSYDFFVPSGFNTPSTLAVVMSDLYSPLNLLLDDVSITSTQNTSVTVPGHNTYNVVYADVTQGYHRLSHTSGGAVSFTAWIYGRTTNGEYAWSLGRTV